MAKIQVVKQIPEKKRFRRHNEIFEDLIEFKEAKKTVKITFETQSELKSFWDSLRYKQKHEMFNYNTTIRTRETAVYIDFRKPIEEKT